MTPDPANSQPAGLPRAQAEIRALAVASFAGRLNAVEQEAFDLRLLGDEDFSRSVAALKEDLLEDYAAGSLDADDKESLRPWVLASGSRREQVRLIRALRRRRRPARRQLAVIWLAAAAACILAVSGLLVWPGASHPSYRAAVHPPQPASARPQPQVLLLEAERLRSATPAAPGLYTLDPDTPLQLQVILPHPATDVFDLVVRPADRHGSQPAPIRVPDLEPVTANGAWYIQTDLPAGSLPAGEYTASLSSAHSAYSTRFRVRLR